MRIRSDALVRAGFALSLLILTGIGALSYHSLTEFIDAAHSVENSHAVIEKLDDLTTEVTDVESACRGFVLAGEDFYLEPYYQALRQVNGTLANLRSLEAGTPDQVTLLQKVDGLCTQELEYMRHTVDVRRERGFDAASQLFRTGRGHQLMDNLRAGIAEMEDDARRSLTERSAAARARGTAAIGALLIGTALSFSLLSFVYYRLHREIVRRRLSQEQTAHLNKVYSVLYEVGQSVIRIRQPEALLEDVCRIAVQNGLLQMAWVGLADPEDCIVPVTQFGGSDGLTERVRIPLRTSSSSDPVDRATAALREGRPYVCSKAAELSWHKGEVADSVSAVIAPLTRAGRVHGAFAVYSSEPGFFSEATVGFVRNLADNISFALESIEQEEQRRRAEGEILQLNRDLEYRIEERTVRLAELNRELALRNDELARASRLKSEFLARMSHELRTPMNAIIGFADLLAEQNVAPLHPEHGRYVTHIQRAGRHLLQLINDILDLSKIEAGRLELAVSSFRVAEALEEVVSVVVPLAQIKAIRIESRVPNDLLLSADRTRFKQILYNLLSNAVKFTAEQGRIWIETRVEAGRICFTVGDTGIGIAQQEQEKIFSEFQQAGETTRGMREGTGLGLAITRKLVELHGGTISVKSGGPGKGSQFTFDLGAAPAQMRQAAHST